MAPNPFGSLMSGLSAAPALERKELDQSFYRLLYIFTNSHNQEWSATPLRILLGINCPPVGGYRRLTRCRGQPLDQPLRHQCRRFDPGVEKFGRRRAVVDQAGGEPAGGG